MKNWAKSFEFHPNKILAPKSTEEAQNLVKECLSKKQNLRMRGSGHSWTKLIATDENYLHLDEMQGILKVNKDKNIISALAGTKLYKFGEEAFQHQLALPNQGDINHQSIAGGLSTGTHGTGIGLKSLANTIQGMKIISGQGEAINFTSENNLKEIKALSVSMGSAGLITEADIQLIPAYKLKVDTFAEDMSEALKHFDERLKNNRHLEMFYFPVGDWSMVKTMNVTNNEVSSFGKLDRLNELVLENWLYEGINILATKTKSYKALDKFMRKFVGHKTFVNWSHRAFPTERTVRFMEMEFNLPVTKFHEVLEEIKASIKKHQFQTLFPIEIRFVQGDDLWLSPAYERDSVYFAIHTYITEDYKPYFEEMQKIFTKHGGRPHWGKWHSLKNDYFETVYPKWNDFKNLRNQLDPQGVWLNPHLKEVFGK